MSLLTKPRPALGAGISYRITTPPVSPRRFGALGPSFLVSERPCPREWQTLHFIEIHPLSARWYHVCTCMCTCAYTCVRVPAHAHRIPCVFEIPPPTPPPSLPRPFSLRGPPWIHQRPGPGEAREGIAQMMLSEADSAALQA